MSDRGTSGASPSHPSRRRRKSPTATLEELAGYLQALQHEIGQLVREAEQHERRGEYSMAAYTRGKISALGSAIHLLRGTVLDSMQGRR